MANLLCKFTIAKGTENTEAGLIIKALEPVLDDSIHRDYFRVILTPDEQNIETHGSCKSANNCKRTKVGYDVATKKFIDLESNINK